MNEQTSPLMSEFETIEKEAAYTAWLTGKIERSRSSTKPLVSHDKVMAEARAVVETKRKKHVAGSVER